MELGGGSRERERTVWKEFMLLSLQVRPEHCVVTFAPLISSVGQLEQPTETQSSNDAREGRQEQERLVTGSVQDHSFLPNLLEVQPMRKTLGHF